MTGYKPNLFFSVVSSLACLGAARLPLSLLCLIGHEPVERTLVWAYPLPNIIGRRLPDTSVDMRGPCSRPTERRRCHAYRPYNMSKTFVRPRGWQIPEFTFSLGGIDASVDSVENC